MKKDRISSSIKDINQSPADSLERQVERGSFFTHTALSRQSERINEIESFLFGLIDLMIKKGAFEKEELTTLAAEVRKELYEKGELAHAGLGIRMDDTKKKIEFVPVNCAERIHICHGVCCKLNFALSITEIESGKIKWDLGKPYFIRQESSGYCSHLHHEKKTCGIYQNRPSVCRGYSCAGDDRIWKDFDNMVINQEWIDENLANRDIILTNGIFMNQ